MRESIVVLLPYVGCQDQIQGGDGLSPRELIADLQPFCMLSRHGVNDSDKCLIACKESVTSGQQIAFQPSLAHVLAEHAVHNTSVSCQAFIAVIDHAVPVPVLLLKDLVKPVGHALIRSEYPEVPALLVQLEDIPDVAAQLNHILSLGLAGVYLNSILAEIRKAQIL